VRGQVPGVLFVPIEGQLFRHGTSIHALYVCVQYAAAGTPSPLPGTRSIARCPTGETRSYAISNCQDGVQAIVLNQARDVPAALRANDPEFPDSCSRIELPFLKEVPQVLVDRPDIVRRIVPPSRPE
jgi:hypothetical protein